MNNKCQFFPGLIELPLSLLDQELQPGNVRGALLVLRDCWEAAVKLLGIALYADLTAAVEDDNDRELIDIVVPLLDKPPSLGAWLTFYIDSSAFAHQAGLTDRLILPELCELVHLPTRRAKGSLRLTAFGKSLWDVVAWRNDTIGHGTASHDLGQVKQVVHEQDEKLRSFLKQIDFLRKIRMFSSAHGGNTIEWNTRTNPSAAEQSSSSLSYFPVWIQRNASTRCLSPLLMMGRSGQHHCLLTFDKLGKGVFFLDYFLSTKVRFPHVSEISNIQMRHLSHGRVENLNNLRQGGALSTTSRAYSGAVVKALERIEFGSDMERWFVKQNYILAALEIALRAFEAQEGRGYFHLVGPAGAGKSWFAAALGNPRIFSGAPQVLRYHIRQGMRQNPDLFIEALQDQAQDTDGHNVRGARIRLEGGELPSRAVADFLEDVLIASSQDRIILVIDGLDEILDPADETAGSILDFIPLPDELPEGVLCVISSRPEAETRKRVRGFLRNIREKNDRAGYLCFDIDGHKIDQEETIRDYLVHRHGVRETAVIDQIISNCRGSFLVAKLLGRIHSLSHSHEKAILPSDLRQAYSRYLSLIRDQVGPQLFDALHRRVLTLLAASPCSLSLQEISDLLGLQEERVLFAFFDTGEFFSTVRQEPGNSFTVSHVEFAQYVLVNHEDEIAARLREILESFRDDEDVLNWLADANSFLARSGHTRLSLFLSRLILDSGPLSYARRVDVLRSYIDMVHITGNYRKAASLLEDLVDTLLNEHGLQPDDHAVVKARLRRAHHLKFVVKVEKAKQILEPLLHSLPEDHPDLPEIRFMYYGSLGCLDDPGKAELDALRQVAAACRKRADNYLLTRCQRRIADLLLLFGEVDEALQVALEAMDMAANEASRQTIYLNSTIAEIFRFQGDLGESLRYHKVCFEMADNKGLPGWKGHGALGIAETYRQQGKTGEADEMYGLARSCYTLADGQAWGLIHVGIGQYFLDGRQSVADVALEIARGMGYRRDVAFLHALGALGSWTKNGHNQHFLLFP